MAEIIPFEEAKKKINKLPTEKKTDVYLKIFRNEIVKFAKLQIAFERAEARQRKKQPDQEIIKLYQTMQAYAKKIPIEVKKAPVLGGGIRKVGKQQQVITTLGETVVIDGKPVKINIPHQKGKVPFDVMTLAHEMTHTGTRSELAADLVSAMFMANFLPPSEIKRRLYNRVQFFKNPEKYMNQIDKAIKLQKRRTALLRRAMGRRARARMQKRIRQEMKRPFWERMIKRRPMKKRA